MATQPKKFLGGLIKVIDDPKTKPHVRFEATKLYGQTVGILDVTGQPVMPGATQGPETPSEALENLNRLIARNA